MSFLFGKKPTVKEQMRANDKVIRKSQREIERERQEIEKMEKHLELEIKKAAKTGNKEILAPLAKQLVNLRKQKAKTFNIGSKMNAIGTQGKVMHSNMKIADAMSSTSKTMGDINKLMDPQKTASVMKEFEKQNTKMGMTEELISDSLDEIMNDVGDEEEEDAVVNQVLDEIGIEISGKMIDAPSVSKGGFDKSKVSEDDEIEKQLAQLRS